MKSQQASAETLLPGIVLWSTLLAGLGLNLWPRVTTYLSDRYAYRDVQRGWPVDFASSRTYVESSGPDTSEFSFIPLTLDVFCVAGMAILGRLGIKMILDQRVRLRVLSWLGGEGGAGSGAPSEHAERMLPWAVVGGVILAAGLMTLWTDNEDGFTYARGWPSVFERWDIGRLNIYIGPRQYEPFHGSFSGRALAVDLVCLAAIATAAGTATRMLIERRYSLRMLLVLTVTISVTMGMVRLAPHVEAQSRQLRSTADGG